MTTRLLPIHDHIIGKKATSKVNTEKYNNEIPTVCGLAADNNNKLYAETMIFLWSNLYNLNFIM